MSSIHKYITRNNTNLHLPNVNITRFYKGPYISCFKAFNYLPRHIEILVNDVTYFKLSLKRFLYHYSFYSIEEYFKYNEDKDMQILIYGLRFLNLFIVSFYAIF